MAKRLAVLVAVVAAMLATAAPAMAQGVNQYGGDRATFTFELTVQGTPPANATFFGNVRFGEGGPGLFVPLTDPDGDGLFTGSTTVDRFGPGPRPVPPGVEPLAFPVSIVQGAGVQGSRPGEPVTVIQDFGIVPVEDRTFSATVSFADGVPGTPGGALPDTGGAALLFLAGGALVAVVGLLAYRAIR